MFNPLIELMTYIYAHQHFDVLGLSETKAFQNYPQIFRNNKFPTAVWVQHS